METPGIRTMAATAAAGWQGHLPVKVLVADDEKDIRALLKTTFALTSEFELIGNAPSLEEACSVLSKVPVDLILLDVYFRTATTGLEAISELRGIQSSVTIVAMTGKAFLQAQCLIYKANGFLAKPFDHEKLFTAIGTVLKGKLYYDGTVFEKMPTRYLDPYFLRVQLPENIVSGDDRAYIDALMCGMSDTDIADMFEVKLESIYQKRSRLCDRLGIKKDLERFLFAQLSSGGGIFPNKA
jgi:DNA-binding NarL/FixJ family response regulator